MTQAIPAAALAQHIAKPVRLQLSRKRGFNLQALSLATNGLPAVNCATPSKLGNPFTIPVAIESGFADEETARPFVVECFRDWLTQDTRSGRDWWQGPESDRRRAEILAGLRDLRGKNCGCWCALPEPGQPDICHAATLLELANIDALPAKASEAKG